jgi:hypothetical protein
MTAAGTGTALCLARNEMDSPGCQANHNADVLKITLRSRFKQKRTQSGRPILVLIFNRSTVQ